jgi:Xaa-Pro aminopeptidase
MGRMGAEDPAGVLPAATSGHVQRLRAWMANQHADAAYITRPVSIAYLTGFRSEPMERLMALAVRPEGSTLIVPALEKDHATNAVADVGVVAWRDGEDAHAVAREALTGAERVAVEKDHLSVRDAELLHLRHMLDASAEVRRMRSVKTAAELEKLRHAAAITDRAYAEVVQGIHIGQSELEVANAISAAINSAGGTLAFEPLVQFGPHSAVPHHRPGDRRLAAGDLVLLDFGAAFDGYCADTTRMAVAGEPDSQQKEIHRLVLQAHDAAIEAVRAGVTAGDVDAAARGVIRDADQGEYFIHRTGHGLGLEAHEDPSLDPGSKTVLEAGMVATIEPGIYMQGWGGVRIEDDIVVEPRGARLLTTADRSLFVIPA